MRLGLGVLLWTLAAADSPHGQLEALEQPLALEQQGDDAGALAAFEALCRTQPFWELPRLELARLRLKRGTPEELTRAEADLEVVRTIAPLNPRLHYLAALAHLERGRRPQAMTELEQALAHRASYTEARYRLASLYLEEGRLEEGTRHLHQVSRERPEWVHARLQLAKSHERSEALEASEQVLKGLLRDFPQSRQVREQLVAFYERTGRPKMAKKVARGMGEEKKTRKLRPLPKSRR